MPEKFKNKYRVGSSRLPGYDYSQNGLYFVTICTKERECFFGEIVNEKMILSEVGKIAKQYWEEIPNHFSHMHLDEFSIMPNHVHGIIEILSDARRDEAMPRLYNGEHRNMSEISPTSGSLAVIIGSYKSIVSKNANKKFPNAFFHWQPRFYDHIIRNDESLAKIREYIRTNPAMWERDRNNDIDDMPTW